MMKKQTHITGLLSLLICLSLNLASYHSHERFEWNQDSHSTKTELPVSINKDSNLCPVCGYLFGADVSHVLPFDTILPVIELDHFTSPVIYNQPTLFDSNSRSPPSLG